MKEVLLEKGVCSGAGGQGMVLVGDIIATASLNEGLAASVYPSYGPEIRGGAAHSSYVIANLEEIANPVVADFNVAIIMNNVSMKQFVCDYDSMMRREEMRKNAEVVGDRRLEIGGV